MHAYIYAFPYMYTHKCRSGVACLREQLHSSFLTAPCGCIHIQTYIYLCTYIYMYIHVSTYIHTYIHTHIYVHT